MRNKLTRLSISAMVLTFGLSLGAASARNILPDAFNNPNWPDQRGSSIAGSSRISPIDESISRPSGNLTSDYRRATDLMSRAIKAKQQGNLAEACRLANRALLIVSRSSSLKGGVMESDYTAFANEACEAAEKI